MHKFPQSLSITRQAIQDIWHVMCHTEKHEVLGVLGMSADGEIIRVQHLASLSQENLQLVADQWKKYDLDVRGIFQSKPLDIEAIRMLEGSISTDDYVYLVLNIDTKGCLKSTLYALKKNQCVELPLVLEDVGQYPSKS